MHKNSDFNSSIRGNNNPIVSPDSLNNKSNDSDDTCIYYNFPNLKSYIETQAIINKICSKYLNKSRRDKCKMNLRVMLLKTLLLEKNKTLCFRTSCLQDRMKSKIWMSLGIYFYKIVNNKDFIT